MNHGDMQADAFAGSGWSPARTSPAIARIVMDAPGTR